MRVGLALPQFDFSVPGEWPLAWPTVVAWAQRAEALGFESLWLADHLFLDVAQYGADDGVAGAFDPLPALAAIARHTRRPRLGVLVLCAPLRPASVVAKALATLDVLSGGRVTVGMGAGWYEPEFAAAGVPFGRPAARIAHLAEGLAVVRGMFGGGPFSFSGRYCTVDEARCLPVPVQRPHPPLWVGGNGDAILRVVAAEADGWNTAWAWTPHAYEARRQALVAACERIGRDPATVTLSLGLYALVGESEADLERRFERLRRGAPHGVLGRSSLDRWRRGRLVGTVEQVRDQLDVWRELGVNELIVGAGALPFTVASPDDLAMIADACSLGPPCQASEHQS